MLPQPLSLLRIACGSSKRPTISSPAKHFYSNVVSKSSLPLALSAQHHKPWATRDSMLITTLLKRGKLADAEDVVRNVMETDTRANILAYTSALISGYLHQGHLERATSWLLQLDARGIATPISILCIFLDTHAKLRNAPRVREFAVRITDHPQFSRLSVRSYNSLISAFARIEDTDAARRYFDRMSADEVVPNQITFCTLIGAFGRAGRVEDAFAIYEKMTHVHKQQPDLRTYASLIKLCSIRPELRERAFQFFDELRARGLTPNHQTYHSILMVCMRRHDRERALEFWKELHKQGLTPNLILYNTLLGVFGRDHLDSAEVIFKELQAGGFVPSTVTINMMIKCAAMNRNFTRALEYFELLRNSSLQPDEHSYNALLSSLRDPQDLPRSELLFNDMRLQGLRPNIVVLNALARVSVMAGDFSKADHFLNQITALGLQPDSATNAVLTLRRRSVVSTPS